MAQIRAAFTTPYDQYKDRQGQPFTMLCKITEPTEEIDQECLPMYEIKFSDGAVILAWPEEVEASD